MNPTLVQIISLLFENCFMIESLRGSLNMCGTWIATTLMFVRLRHSDSDKFIRFSTSYKETTKQQQQNAENQETST